jgi:hypothetical protein
VNLNEHADAIAAFYKRLTDAGVPADVAGVVTIDTNKALHAGHAKPPEPSKDERKADLQAAAEEKRQRRLAEVGG